MPTPTYQTYYLSGTAELLRASPGAGEDLGSFARVYLTNNLSGGDQVARVFMHRQDQGLVAAEYPPLYDSGEITLSDGQMWIGGYAPDPQHESTEVGTFCASIFATSPRVVPSMLVVNTPNPATPGKWAPGQIYFSPGDFAVEPVAQPSSALPFIGAIPMKH